MKDYTAAGSTIARRVDWSRAKWRLGAGIADAVVRHFRLEAPEAGTSFLLDAVRLANQAAHQFQFSGALSMVL